MARMNDSFTECQKSVKMFKKHLKNRMAFSIMIESSVYYIYEEREISL